MPKPRFAPEPDPENGIAVTENGIAYKIKDAPFEFQYSYTETPKVKPLALREQPYLPFGPGTMPRPWTGRKPLPESKKKLPEFDSFKLPPAGKKGVKPVQHPGPFLMGAGPKYTAMTREEVLGEPLTAEEVKELVKGCLKTKRQLNMGRDGLTHNMLDNIHAHWKRRRVCKIKCKGVCTVDMDNVRQQLEEKTGGKIIYGRGGVIFLFRGRNYNYRTRPRYPLMLWKPVTPVYPRLVQKAPEGLTLEEASEMRKRGRQLPPLCKLGKNGVYSNLVRNVREAFEACELVRIDCKDMNKSDCRKIGAKLKDLVPCVLISFEFEHILMWRGKDWKSSLSPPEDNSHKLVETRTDDSPTTSPSISDLKIEESLELNPEKSSNRELTSVISQEKITPTEEKLDLSISEHMGDSTIVTSKELNPEITSQSISSNGFSSLEDIKDLSQPSSENPTDTDMIETQSNTELKKKCLDGVMLLLNQAVESGSAMILDNEELDANNVYERSVALAKSAPAGPVFQHRIRKVRVQKIEKEKTENSEELDLEVEAIIIPEEKSNRNSFRSKKREGTKEVPGDVPRGSLRVDELAKLLA
ncbi:uncharacterized protein A4U43_C05F19510 [Asparagus officinalis]|uniref:CRM domain-containing protein n=1 Tax=Asparagus officinalis TaxID=4686 RepID=A0A5P1ESU4_ASPOF|nr:CRS2-associated factor 1, chloroplastic [Asparagus officinalis]ONK69115.1 uncharacterized protein A4U43_C05F19510 [Asparagus officinalis]